MKTTLSQFELECITAAAYEVNRQYCLMVSTGDHSHVAWPELDAQLRTVALMATAGIAEGYTPEKSHAAWMMMKKSQGWRYGQTKNQETLEHPCLVPFSELPLDQQAKDLLWHGTVTAMLNTRWKIPQQ